MRFYVALVTQVLVALIVAFIFSPQEVQIAAVGAVERGWVALVSNATSASAGAIALGGALMTWWNGQKATAAVGAAEAARSAVVKSQTVLEGKLDKNTELTQAIKITKDDMETHAVGAGRQAVEEFKRATTVPAPLSTDFDPAATDLGAAKK